MIIIQVLLIVSIVAVVLRFLSSSTSSQTLAWKKILLFGFAIIAGVMIIFPTILDGIAHAVGVGRGADLLLYALTVAFIYEQINNHLKTKEEQKNIVILSRKLAIMEANIAKKDGNFKD